MAQVVLSAAGARAGGPLGAAIGRAVGGLIDRAAIASLAPPREAGPRLTTLQVMSAAEGAPIPAVFGRARVAGQVIWAARFKAARIERRDGGGKGGPRTVEESYSLSFACALGDGPIDGVGRVWADGKPMEMAGVAMRVHLGAEDEAPDSLIEAVEGEAPAYRGTAYVVFEDLPLGAYGNRVPQLSFEVFRRPRGDKPGLEELLTEVCLIPGAGEFVYATEPVLRKDGLTRAKAENVNNPLGRTDLLVSLDQLGAQLPNVKSVTLVVSWFGDDLRAGECEVRPGVEFAEKHTLPFAWRAGGLDRSQARVLADDSGEPAYGGTPADRTVLQIIAELKARGYSVTLYPFLMMDVRPGNGLPDPHGGAEQAAFPWRGRITCHPAPGRAASPDRTPAAAEQVEAFFGTAAAGQFSLVDGEVRFAGVEWSWSRMVLHYAHLAELAGGVDGFLIGSEFRGLTWVRDGANSYPAVWALRRLAGECRQVLRPETAVSYAADWSEWFGHQPTDGSGHLAFHLDPLWSDPAISFVGVDWYPPGADWRHAPEHLDVQAGAEGPHDPEYLLANVMGGEGYDWFYASDAHRAAQVRTPIEDGAHGEPWVFRPKDIVNWWSREHHDRPDGLRAAESTAWVPRSKPVRLVEFGAPAIDLGANSPNLFYDPKSSESGLPPFSDGSRDDLGQRRAVEAVLTYFSRPENNPISPIYAGSMVAGLSAWCWDARPFPDFPGRAKVWADSPNWTYGHWLNGRAGVAPAAELLVAVLARGGVRPGDLDLAEASGSVTGYVVDRPMTLRDAITPLMDAFSLDAAERGGRLTVLSRDRGPVSTLLADNLAWEDGEEASERWRRELVERPSGARVRFTDEAGDYAVATAEVAAEETGRAGVLSLDLPVVTDRPRAERVAARRLRRAWAETVETTAHLSPETMLRLETGDGVLLDDDEAMWRVVQVVSDEAPRARLVRAEAREGPRAPADPMWRPGEPLNIPAPPVLHLLDLPPLPGSSSTDELDPRPLVAASGDPWRGVEVLAGANSFSLTTRARVSEPDGVGVTLTPLAPGQAHRIQRSARLSVRVESAALQNRSWLEVASGSNAVALQHQAGDWEILQFLHAELVARETYVLSGLLRGQAGTDSLITGPVAPGAHLVVLHPELVRAQVSAAELGAQLLWRAIPTGSLDTVSTSEATFTWRGLHGRPWAPVHLRARPLRDGGVRFSWTRRARVGGDSWAGKPPLSEQRESYRAELRSNAQLVRAWQTSAPEIVYGAQQLAADFPAGAPGDVTLEVRQGSATFGWGAPARRNCGYEITVVLVSQA